MMSIYTNDDQHLKNNLKFDIISDQLKHCNIATKRTIKITYVCFKNEICCENGCCVTSMRKIAQYWLILVMVCIVAISCMHYFKRVKVMRAERIIESRSFLSHRRSAACRRHPDDVLVEDQQNQQSLPIGLHAPTNVMAEVHRDPFPLDLPSHRRPIPAEIDDLILERLLVSFRNSRSNPFGPNMPPEYSTVEKNIYDEPPPKYSVACRLLQENGTRPPGGTANEPNSPDRESTPVEPALAEITDAESVRVRSVESQIVPGVLEHATLPARQSVSEPMLVDRVSPGPTQHEVYGSSSHDVRRITREI